MQKVLARYVLCDLLRKQFNGNKAQMARQLDLSVRTVYRILNGEEVEHNGNTALSRALDYYIEHRIPLESAFHDFIIENDTSGKVLDSLPEQYRELLVKTTTFSVD